MNLKFETITNQIGPNEFETIQYAQLNKVAIRIYQDGRFQVTKSGASVKATRTEWEMARWALAQGYKNNTWVDTFALDAKIRKAFGD